ncbi:MAG: V-type ATP synthase subunit I [Candidatus Diapherotrites archaeon]|nr:V-type ATP synthase subunit I [Candidatus Diapherotrites archaeon]
MIKPKKMKRVTIVGSRRLLKPIVENLYNQKVLHINDYSKIMSDEYLDIGHSLKNADIYSESLVKIKSVCSYLNISFDKGLQGVDSKLLSRDLSKENLRDLRSKINNIEKEVVEKVNKRKSLEEELSGLSSVRKELEPFTALALPLNCFHESKSVSFAVGFTPVNIAASDFEDITSRLKVVSAKHGKKQVVAVFAESAKMAAVLERISSKGFSEISMENIAKLSGSAKDNVNSIESNENKILREIENLKVDLFAIRQKWEIQLFEYNDFLSQEIEKASAPLKFAVTKTTFIVKGWILEENYKHVTKEIERAGKGKVLVNIHKDVRIKEAPIALKDKGPANSFEMFLDLYSLPRYNEIDPTLIMALAFPLFFGFMLGDIGYGLVLLALTVALKKMKPELNKFLNVLMFSAIGTMIFGFVFGEFFGATDIFGMPLYHYINREHDVNFMMTLSILIGVVHINLGLVIGFYNKMVEHGMKMAFYEKGSWILLEIGAALLGASMMGLLPLSPVFGGVVLLASIVFIYLGEGIKGLAELPSILSNILSYSRLMAVGLASVSLAVVVNEMAGDLIEFGGIGMILALIVLILGHLINLALGILGPFLHSLRLHYVEFFGKFYEGGGEEYSPFGKNK